MRRTWRGGRHLPQPCQPRRRQQGGPGARRPGCKRAAALGALEPGDTSHLLSSQPGSRFFLEGGFEGR